VARRRPWITDQVGDPRPGHPTIVAAFHVALGDDAAQALEVLESSTQGAAHARDVIAGSAVDATEIDRLAALAGSVRDVGVVGYTLGGGLSWLARSHGLAANHVTAAEVVTADGALLRVDDTHHADLFWAIRGGGGSFGIVTALEFALFPITQVIAGALFWPVERAPEVLQVWRRAGLTARRCRYRRAGGPAAGARTAEGHRAPGTRDGARRPAHGSARPRPGHR
jgi:FAD/FMN-containing dehydrogenase